MVRLTIAASVLVVIVLAVYSVAVRATALAASLPQPGV